MLAVLVSGKLVPVAKHLASLIVFAASFPQNMFVFISFIPLVPLNSDPLHAEALLFLG